MNQNPGASGLPPPKDFRSVNNSDPALGGFQYNTVGFAPMCNFASAVGRTPQSQDLQRTIPWDSKRCDYVYEAVDDKVFQGRMTKKNLKDVSFV